LIDGSQADQGPLWLFMREDYKNNRKKKKKEYFQSAPGEI
jgi:hypothetical protein